MQLFLSLFLFLALQLQHVFALFNPTEYVCSICISIVKEIFNGQASYDDLCSHYNACDLFNKTLITTFTFNNKKQLSNENFRTKCISSNYCPSRDEKWLSYKPKTSDALNLRISKGYGARGNDKIRVSVISNNDNIIENNNIFTYTKPFKYRWTQYYLSTGIIDVKPGMNTQITIGKILLIFFLK